MNADSCARHRTLPDKARTQRIPVCFAECGTTPVDLGARARASARSDEMKWAGRVLLLTLGAVVFGEVGAAQNAPQPMKRLLIIGEEKGYRHEAVSHAMATMERLGRESGLWTTTIRTDT